MIEALLAWHHGVLLLPATLALYWGWCAFGDFAFKPKRCWTVRR